MNNIKEYIIIHNDGTWTTMKSTSSKTAAKSAMKLNCANVRVVEANLVATFDVVAELTLRPNTDG